MENILEKLENLEKRLSALEAKSNEGKHYDSAYTSPKGNSVEFDGFMVHKYNGVFRCPHKCTGQDGYPERTWKTEKGFLGHKCKKNKSILKVQKLRRAEDERPAF